MKKPYRHHWQIMVRGKGIYSGYSLATLHSIIGAWVISSEPGTVEVYRDGQLFVTVSATYHAPA